MMKTISLAIVGAATISALSVAPAALAQTKPAAAKPGAASAAPAPEALAITATAPGVCILSRQGIVQTSTVGKYVGTRLQQLQTQATAELTGDQTTLQTAAKDLEAKKATLGDAGYQQQGQALQQREQALQQKAQQRERELQATEDKAVARILQEATPFVAAQVKAANCGVVLDAQAVVLANQAMNLTPAVVTALNAKFTQFDFDREHLDGQPAPQQR